MPPPTTGPCIKCYASGQKQEEGQLLDGKEHGKWQGWFENGALQFEKHFENGVPAGIWRFYYKTGKLHTEYGYEQGRQHGVFTAYLPNGRPYRVECHRNGLRHGWTRDWFVNGQLQSEIVYENGAEEGDQRHFFEHGQLQALWHWVHGKLHGPHFGYAGNGTLLEQGEMCDGEKQGRWLLDQDFEVYYNRGTLVPPPGQIFTPPPKAEQHYFHQYLPGMILPLHKPFDPCTTEDRTYFFSFGDNQISHLVMPDKRTRQRSLLGIGLLGWYRTTIRLYERLALASPHGKFVLLAESESSKPIVCLIETLFNSKGIKSACVPVTTGQDPRQLAAHLSRNHQSTVLVVQEIDDECFD